MAKINPTTHKLDKPGRSIYLSNAQWATLEAMLNTLLDTKNLVPNEEEQKVISKLLRMADEVACNGQ